MRFHRESRVTRIALMIFFVLAAAYALFEIRGQILGPAITIEDVPALVHDPFITISGQALRIASLSMNGGEITVTENGLFSEPYVLAPGYNRIAFDAKDAYGHTRERVVEVMYDAPAATSAPQPALGPSATTTPWDTHSAAGSPPAYALPPAPTSTTQPTSSPGGVQ